MECVEDALKPLYNALEKKVTTLLSQTTNQDVLRERSLPQNLTKRALSRLVLGKKYGRRILVISSGETVLSVI
jgi:hypothetical protein